MAQQTQQQSQQQTPMNVLAFPTGAAPDVSATVRPMVADDPTPEDVARRERMAEAWRAYKGKLKDPLVTKPNQPNSNTKSNRCEPIVTTGVSFLFGDEMQFTVDAGASEETAPGAAGAVATGDATAQQFLDAFWKRNRKQTTLQKLGINGAVFGHTFAMLLPAGDRDTPPRLMVLDPQSVRVETAPGDCDTALAFVVQYEVEQRDAVGNRVAVERRKVIERNDPDGDALMGLFDDDATWIITDQEREKGTTWRTTHQEEWLYNWPPLFHCQNLPEPNEFWGTPDLTPDLIASNQNLNRTQSNIQKILDYFAAPKRYATGMGGGGTLDADPAVIPVLPPGAEIKTVEMASNLSSSLEFLKVLRDNMDEQSRVPAVAVGRQEALPRGNLSGVALELLFQPLMQKTAQKRPLYGEMLEEINSAVLELAGFTVASGDYAGVENEWPQVLPHDPMQDWSVAAEKNAMGVSKYTILTENGYDPDEELQRSQDEKQQGVIQAQAMFGRGQGLPPFPPTSRGLTAPQPQPATAETASGASDDTSPAA